MKLSSSAGSVKGVGKLQAARLTVLGIETVRDVLWHVPVRYEDMRKMLTLGGMRAGEFGTITGVIERVGSRKTRSGQMLFEAIVRAGEERVPLAWFGNRYLQQQLVEGVEYRFSGKVSPNWPAGAALVGAAFELSSAPKVQTARMLPVYELTAGVTVKMMRRYVVNALAGLVTLPEVLPASMVLERRFPSRLEAFRMLHDPSDESEVARARERLAFEEVYLAQLAATIRKREREASEAPAVPFQEAAVKRFVAALSFALTAAQKRATWQILQDLELARPMHRLLNGDVGSGKTAVAAVAAMNVAVCGKQTAVLAPTDILARQHFEKFASFLASEPKIEIGLLTQSGRMIASGGGAPEKISKKEFDAMLRANLIQIAIGTHALLEEWVTMPDLALAIVDEQHRFGVGQRERLKGRRGDALEPHFLSMTATPIPRSLALAMYGDLDLSVLDEMPPGRTPVLTQVMPRRAAHAEIGRAMMAGERGYVVCPLIDPSDELGVKSVEEVLGELTRAFPTLAFRALHGRMKADEKDEAMQWLKERGGRCVVSTTVVEVGVDVQEATFICIEAAERFGLAELHQLRGRVGRGSKPGRCLLAPSEGVPGSARLTILVKESSGFRIAEYDLKMRGHGDLVGRSQSGLLAMFKIASLEDTALLERAQIAARETVQAGEVPPEIRDEVMERFTTHAA